MSLKNLEAAYAEIKEKFFNPIKNKYSLGSLARGIDGDCFAIFQRNIKKGLKIIQSELMEFADPLPSIDLKIPKSSNPNKFRTISISTLKEKIKHHAICRIMEPRLEELYVDNLYSYRPGKGAYQAIKDFRKIMLRQDNYFIYKVDLADYFDNLNHAITLGLVDKYFKDSDLLKLLQVFLKQPRLSGNKILQSNKGVVQGIAISAHLANLYLMELDRIIAEQGIHYFRVGDDILVLHQDKEKLVKIAQFIENFLTIEMKLPINREKTKIYQPDEYFEYLGYEIKGKKMKIAERNLNKMKNKIRQKLNKKFTAHLNRKKVDSDKLLTETMELVFPKDRLPDHIMWLRYFTLTNNINQLREFDNFLENRIRLVYFGNKRNKHFTVLPLQKLRKYNYVSLSKIYFDITRGRKSFSDYVKKFTKCA